VQIDLSELEEDACEREARELIVFADGVEAANPEMLLYAQRARNVARVVLELAPQVRSLRRTYSELRADHERLLKDAWAGKFGVQLDTSGCRYRGEP
jgi:hypothetical protein